MKKIFKILIFVLIASVGLVSCNDLLDVNSDRVTFEQNYRLSSPNDTIYSMIGIYTQLQKLADSYVLLGELRGDLLDVTQNSNLDLREINDFEISKTNKYANIKDFYAVINNCNYVIQNIDTASIIKGQKVMYEYYAAAKGIRAWTYMQIALNWGSVKYYQKPILTVADADAVNNSPDMLFNELADSLIADIKPWKETKAPAFLGSSGVISIRFLLGDLYLWTNRYLEAATEYHDLMYNNRLLINTSYQSSWFLVNNLITTTINKYWYYSFMPGYSEDITDIACPTAYGQRFDMDSLNLNYEFTPSAVVINDWDSQTYYNTAANKTTGDLRKLESIINKNQIISVSNGTITYYTNPQNSTNENIVYKYLYHSQSKNSQSVIIYRSSLLYLRYAEAVNRLGKPNLAFAVLKNGLKATTLASTKVIPIKERSTETYMNFNDFRFDTNCGIRSRGLGPKLGDLSVGDTTYVLPYKPLLNDSVLYVEDLIQKELALETAFEGNRFHDLMRIAIRRDDNSYLANIVAEKYTDNKEAIRNKLMTRSNWYIAK